MKVTDEMVERAMAVSVGGRVLIRNILEAALADVPEPGEAIYSASAARALRRMIEAQSKVLAEQRNDLANAEAKLAKLEAKLEKVRAYLSESPTVLRGQLLDILDGKEPP